MCMKAEFCLDPSWQFLSLKQEQTCLLNEEILFKCNLWLLRHTHFSSPSIRIRGLCHATGSETVLVQRGTEWWQTPTCGSHWGWHQQITMGSSCPLSPAVTHSRAAGRQSRLWLSVTVITLLSHPCCLTAFEIFWCAAYRWDHWVILAWTDRQNLLLSQRGNSADSTKWFCNTNY